MDVRRKFLIVSMAIATVAAGLFLLWRRPGTRQPNILWITMDSLRADHLGCTGYDRAHTPHIDSLAAESVLFAECLAQAPYTHISMLNIII